MPNELILPLLLLTLGIIQALALWILSGLRSGLHDLWTAVTEVNKIIHRVETRVAVLESAIEKRKPDHLHY